MYSQCSSFVAKRNDAANHTVINPRWRPLYVAHEALCRVQPSVPVEVAAASREARVAAKRVHVARPCARMRPGAQEATGAGGGQSRSELGSLLAILESCDWFGSGRSRQLAHRWRQARSCLHRW